MRTSFAENKEPLLLKGPADDLEVSEDTTELEVFSNSEVAELSPSPQVQSFLNNIGLTVTDLIEAKISIVALNQLFNLPLFRRILRWLTSEDILLKLLLFPMLDERGINLAYPVANHNCLQTFRLWYASRTWLGAAAIPFQSEKMLKRAYGTTGFFQGVEDWVSKIWSGILLGCLSYDIYFYYAYPEERYDTTLFNIFFTQADNTKSVVASLIQPTIWPELFILPVAWGVYNAIYGVCSAKPLDTVQVQYLQDTLKNYQPSIWRDVFSWFLPCNTLGNAIAAISQSLLWDNRLAYKDRKVLFEALRQFVRRSYYVSQAEGLAALGVLAYGVSSKDFERLRRFQMTSENIAQILLTEINAFEELNYLAKLGYSSRSRLRYVVANYMLWKLGQSHSKALPWLFLAFIALKLYARIKLYYLIGEGLYLMIERYIQRRRCEEQGMLWMYMDRVADYVCSMCGDLNVFYRDIFTIKDCLNDFLSRRQEVSQLQILFNRVNPSDNITSINLSLQDLSDQQELLVKLLPIMTERMLHIQKLDLSGHISKMGPQGMRSIGRYLPQMRSLRDLDLNSQDLEDNAVLAELPKTTVQFLHLDDNNIGPEGIRLFAKGLKNSSIVELNFLLNRIGSGMTPLAEALEDSNVEELRLEFTELDNEAMQALAPALHNSKVKNLDVSFNNIGPEGMRALTTNVPRSIEELYLGVNPILDEGAWALAAIIPFLKNLRILSSLSNGITSNGTVVLSRSLLNSPIQIFILGNSELGIEGARALAAILPYTSIRDLYLEMNNIGDDELIALSEGIANSTTIQRLYLGNNKIGPKGLQALASALLSNPIIKVLDLSDNLIGDEGAAILASVLRYTSLEELHLRKNNIGDDGAYSLGEALFYAIVQRLDLGENRIGARGAEGLSVGLSNPNLMNLHLYHNQIGTEGIEALGRGLLTSNLQFLSLINNTITWEGTEAFFQVLSDSVKLSNLDLSTNPIGNKGVKSIATKLPSLNIKNLSLRRSAISNEGAVILASALPVSKLQALQLNDNGIGDEGAEAIAQVLITSVSNRALESTLNPNLKRVLAQAEPNTNLVSLSLQMNGIKTAGAVALCRVAPQTKIPIQNLYLADNPGIDSNVVNIQTCTISAAASRPIPWPYKIMGQAYGYLCQSQPTFGKSNTINAPVSSFQFPTTSVSEKLITANWILHYGRKIVNFIAERSPFTLPWNRAKTVSDEQEKQLELQQKRISQFEANVISQKQSRAGKNPLLQDKFNYLDTQISHLKRIIEIALHTKKIIQNEQAHIEIQLERLEKIIHELSMANRQLKHSNIKIRREISRAKNKNETIVVVTQYTPVNNSCSQKALSLQTQEGQSRFSALQQFWGKKVDYGTKNMSKPYINHPTHVASTHFLQLYEP